MTRKALSIMIVLLILFEVASFFITKFGLADFLKFMPGGNDIAIIVSLIFFAVGFVAVWIFSKIKNGENAVLIWTFVGFLFVAGLNAIIWWWGMGLAIGSGPDDIFNKGVPLFLAVILWLIRILLVGTTSLVLGKVTK